MTAIKYAETAEEIQAVLETEEWRAAVKSLESAFATGTVVQQLRRWQRMQEQFGPRLMMALDEWMRD